MPPPTLPTDPQSATQPLRLDDPDDPRAEPYRLLINAPAPGAGDRLPGLFLGEGARTVGLLLQGGWPMESLLLSERRAAALPHLISAAHEAGAAVYSATQEVLDGIAGWNVHRGVLAVLRRPAPRRVDDVVAGAGRLLLCIEGVNDMENLGALFRNAAAFGTGGVVLDRRAADPLYRRAVRVSVGHVLDVPYARAATWPDDLVGAARAGGRRILALTPAGKATLDEATAPADLATDATWAVLVGAEGPGLSEPALEAADVTVRIPMATAVDSVNVATAAAIALHRLARLA